MDHLTKRLTNVLAQRKENNSFRVLKDYSDCIDFLSNDYLGLAKGRTNTFEKVKNHGGSSRLIAGTTSQHTQLEDFLAGYFTSPAALLFNSGYDANVGLLSTIPKKGDVVLYDELCHASIKDGLQLSHAKRLKFKHNNTADLNRLLKKYKEQTTFVVVEGLYSMDGDFAPLEEIDKLVHKHKAYLVVDEAHSAGVIGKNGTGLTNFKDINTPFARIITFGKAFGAHGACVLSNQTTKEYLINFARSFIYTTALPSSMVQQVHDHIKLTDYDTLQQSLRANIATFRGLLPNHYLKSDPLSPIQIIESISKKRLLELEKSLLENGFGVKTILAPTVKEGSERMRIAIHSTHSSEELAKLGNFITSILG